MSDYITYYEASLIQIRNEINLSATSSSQLINSTQYINTMSLVLSTILIERERERERGGGEGEREREGEREGEREREREGERGRERGRERRREGECGSK